MIRLSDIELLISCLARVLSCDDIDSFQTYFGHMRTTNISRFKSHISEELRRVRAGDHVVIVDRDIPVAEVIPYREREEKLRIRSPKRPLVRRRMSFSLKTDPLQYLLEERTLHRPDSDS